MAILIPLMAFEVLVEALILRWFWKQPFRELCRFTFRANCWSLVAGIPTKILNAAIYAAILPNDLPGFFERFALAMAVGSFVYFVVTVLVEGNCAMHWCRREDIHITRTALWKGILVANIVIYAVVSPLYYFATKPPMPVHELTRDTRWTKNPGVIVVYTNSASAGFQAIRLDGSPAALPPLDRIVEWGKNHEYDICGNLTARAERGLGSGLIIYQNQKRLAVVYMGAGLMQLSLFNFGNVAFVGDCNECVFQANGHLYLLDIANSRIGTLTRGDQFVLLGEPVLNTNAPPGTHQ